MMWCIMQLKTLFDKVCFSHGKGNKIKCAKTNRLTFILNSFFTTAMRTRMMARTHIVHFHFATAMRAYAFNYIIGILSYIAFGYWDNGNGNIFKAIIFFTNSAIKMYVVTCSVMMATATKTIFSLSATIFHRMQETFFFKHSKSAKQTAFAHRVEVFFQIRQ